MQYCKNLVFKVTDICRNRIRSAYTQQCDDLWSCCVSPRQSSVSTSNKYWGDSYTSTTVGSASGTLTREKNSGKFAGSHSRGDAGGRGGRGGRAIAADHTTHK
jgi:hypothetical protein